MRKRDGLLLAPIVLVGAMMASFAVSSRPLAEPLDRKARASGPETATDEDERRPKDGRDVT